MFCNSCVEFVSIYVKIDKCEKNFKIYLRNINDDLEGGDLRKKKFTTVELYE